MNVVVVLRFAIAPALFSANQKAFRAESNATPSGRAPGVGIKGVLVYGSARCVVSKNRNSVTVYVGENGDGKTADRSYRDLGGFIHSLGPANPSPTTSADCC